MRIKVRLCTVVDLQILFPIFLLVPHQNFALSRLSPTLSNLVCIPECNLCCVEGKYLFLKILIEIIVEYLGTLKWY
jgi:hypothetical protein